MQFDDACKVSAYDSGPSDPSSWNETVHQTITKKFNDAGYDLPTLVYWNIRGEGGVKGTLPARADQPGVELVSGYSASMMKAFLGMDDNGEDEEVEKADSGDGKEDADGFDVIEEEEENVAKAAKPKVTPAQKLAKILSHPSFSRLRVLD